MSINNTIQNTPLLFIVFNRPLLTKRVFKEIKKYKPTSLYIAADGPRKNIESEVKRCQEVRRIVEKIDWKCDLHKLYRKDNLGCRKAVSSALDWFFQNVDQGIILEDDCLPNQSFFRFCHEMLIRYKDEQGIFHIGGDNFQPESRQLNNSYYFSKYTHIWGWATWRRAWKNYDVNMKSWPEKRRSNILINLCPSFWEKQYWQTIFDATYSGKIDTWDYQWLYTAWLNNALSIVPGKNLVRNIGFSSDSTHMTDKSKSFELISKEMKFPIKDSEKLTVNREFDDFTTKNNFHADYFTVIALKTKYFLERYIWTS